VKVIANISYSEYRIRVLQSVEEGVLRAAPNAALKKRYTRISSVSLGLVLLKRQKREEIQNHITV